MGTGYEPIASPRAIAAILLAAQVGILVWSWIRPSDEDCVVRARPVTEAEVWAFRERELMPFTQELINEIDEWSGPRCHATPPVRPPDLRENIEQLRLWLQITERGSARALMLDDVEAALEARYGQDARRRALLEAWALRPGTEVPNDEEIVRQARQYLQRSWPTQLMLEIDARCPTLTHRELVGEPSRWREENVIPGAFTRWCWETQAAPRLSSAEAMLGEDRWVLGVSQVEAERLLEDARREYVQSYAVAWHGVTYQVDALDDVSRIAGLIAQIAYHTTPTGALGAELRAEFAEVARADASPALEECLALIQRLREEPADRAARARVVELIDELFPQDGQSSELRHLLMRAASPSRPGATLP